MSRGNETAVWNEDQPSTFTAYPNPATNEVFVKWSEYLDQGELLLYNVQGSLVYETAVSGYFSILPLHELEQGTYYLELRTGTNVWHQKLIKQ